MFELLSLLFFAAAATGLLLLAAQLFALRIHVKNRPALPREPTPISILKPLCGVDDELEANLEHFATLDYPAYEVLLGVRSATDPAWPLAMACAARHPGRVRVFLQRGERGLNPKVNQLLTLAEEARNEILVVSDSNVRVRRGYLHEIAAFLEDSGVGLVTHPIVGVGERRLGSLLDNLQLATHTAPGTVSAKLLAGRDIVVGKSMAMRRSDLERLGGFASVKDVLAEDYVLGVAFGEKLGKRVVLGAPIENVSQHRTVAQFVARYERWAVMQRKIAGPFAYGAQLLLNPFTLALGGFVAAPSSTAAILLASVALARVGMDASFCLLLRGDFPPAAVFASPLRDLLLAWTWVLGLLRNSVDWRGNRLVVLQGSRLGTSDGVVLGDSVEAA